VDTSSNPTPVEASIHSTLDAAPGRPQQRGDDEGGAGYREAREPQDAARELGEEDGHGGIAQSEHGGEQAVSNAVDNAVVSDGGHRLANLLSRGASTTASSPTVPGSLRGLSQYGSPSAAAPPARLAPRQLVDRTSLNLRAGVVSAPQRAGEVDNIGWTLSSPL
jgi:hypothetical protein